LVIRWLKFNAVGMLGAVVQLGVLALLTRLGVHYLIATALAVETALLHNFVWHVRWTWLDRPATSRWGALWRFQVANGAISLLSNLVLMRLFTGSLGWPVLMANLIAIAITSAVNFLLGDRWVFARQSGATPAGRSS
jgi:putative flippase GtrA